jgi:acetyl esterase/lipase
MRQSSPDQVTSELKIARRAVTNSIAQMHPFACIERIRYVHAGGDIMMRFFKWAMAMIVLILAVAAGSFYYSPALLVDTVDRIASRADVVKVADGVVFGAERGNKLDIWSPAKKDAKPRPVLVFFYGGGWANGTRTEYSYAARPFVEAGYIVVLPDYRKVPEVLFPGFVADSAAAVKWVQANIGKYGGDPARVSVAGHSAGAYNAVMLAMDPRWLGDKPVRAAISLAGPADFYPFTSKRAIDAMSKVPDPRVTQPINFVGKNVPPLLLIHGTEDTVVRIRNANSLYAKQKSAGGNITLRAQNGASHDDMVLSLSTLFRGRYPVVKESVAFLDAHNRP